MDTTARDKSNAIVSKDSANVQLTSRHKSDRQFGDCKLICIRYDGSMNSMSSLLAVPAG